jgi:uncharacterized repeat protein (TIGR01451 family)
VSARRAIAVLVCAGALAGWCRPATAGFTITSSAAQVVDQNGDGAINPGDVIEYTVTVTNEGPGPVYGAMLSDPLSPGTSVTSVSARANDDAYLVLGDGAVSVPAAVGLVGNNDGGTVTVTAFDATSRGGASVSVSDDGSFVYQPAGALPSHDRFGYTITDDRGQEDAAEVLLMFAGALWHADNTAGAGGTGTAARPFDTLRGAQDAAAPGDAIFVHAGTSTDNAGYDEGIRLQDDQILLGQSSPVVTIDTATGASGHLPAGPPSARPLVTNVGDDDPLSSDPGVVLFENNVVKGFRLGCETCPTFNGRAIVGVALGDAVVQEVTAANANTTLVDLRNGNVHASFDAISNTSATVPNSLLLSTTLVTGDLEVRGLASGNQPIGIGGGPIDVLLHTIDLVDPGNAGLGAVENPGTVTVLSDGGGIRYTGDNDASPVSFQDCGRVTLSGRPDNPFVIEGAGMGSGGDTARGITATNVDDVRIEHVEVQVGSDPGDVGVFFVDNGSAVLTNAIVEVTGGGDAISLFSSDATRDHALVVTDNVILGDASYADNGDTGIQLLFGSTAGRRVDAEIARNSITGTTGNGINVQIESGAGTMSGRSGITLAGNMIRDHAGFGLTVHARESALVEVAITDTTVDGEVSHPVAARGIGFEPDFGVFISTNDDAVMDLTMQGNTIRDVDEELVSLRSTGAAALRGSIADNTLQSVTVATVDPAIEAVPGGISTMDLTIRGNRISTSELSLSLENTEPGPFLCAAVDANLGNAAGTPPAGAFSLRRGASGGITQIEALGSVSTRNGGVTVQQSGALSDVPIGACDLPQ